MSRSWAVYRKALQQLALILIWLPVLVVGGLAADSEPQGDAEAMLDRARQLESAGDYIAAAEQYRTFLASEIDSPIKTLVMTRLSVLQEAERLGVDGALTLYLQALDAREQRQVDVASARLQQILTEFPGSYLVDDSLYLQGYIAMMDAYQFGQAQQMFKQLREQHPDSSYIDTALYSEAISLEQLGNTQSAKQRFEMLRDRHTEFALSLFGVHWPKSDYLSRYWFDRANNRLKIIEQRLDSAARVVTQKVDSLEGQDLQVEVDVQGRVLRLILQESSLVQNTRFDAEAELSLAMSAARYYIGRVEGDSDSWVRVMIRNGEIRGIVETAGERVDLESASMIGTLDYYKPDDGKPGSIEEMRLQDYVMHPPVDLDADRRDGLQVDKDEPSLGAARSDGINRLIRMNVYVDSQYNDYYGGDGLLQAMSALNVADGIYRKNFGLAIEVGNATVFTDRSNDPMNLGAVTLETTLRRFRDHHMQTRKQGEDIGLTYLFSGNDNVDEAIGLAWIGAVCRTDGFDVGVTTPSSYADLLVTHELGHSLGAQHDTDTDCSGSRNMLMWPRISQTTTQSFSNCSHSSVNSGIGKSCLLNTVDVSLQVEPVGSSIFRLLLTNNDVVSTANNANLVVEAAALDLDQLPSQCIESSAAELVCQVTQLHPGETVGFDFSLGAASSHHATLMARVEAVDYYDVVPLNNAARLSLDPSSGNVAAVQQSVAEDNALQVASNAQFTNAAVSGESADVGGGGSADWWFLVSAFLSGLMMRSAIAGI